MICSEVSSTCAGIGLLRKTRQHRAHRRQHADRLDIAVIAVLGVILGGELVAIELPCRKRGAQQRRRTEPEIAISCELQRAVLAAVTDLDLVETCRRIIRFHLGRDPPGRHVAAAALARCSRQRHGALEPRRAGLEGQDAVEIGQYRTLAGIDVEVQTGAAAVGALPRGDPERVAVAVEHEIAVAADRAGKRADIAAEGNVVQLERAAACGIVQCDASGQIEAIDRQRSQVEAPARRRPVDPPLWIEPEIERHAVDGELVGAPLAAHQRAEAELDIEIGGPDLAEVVGAADGDGFQPQRGRGQQARVEIAGDTNRRADDLGRLRLELRPEPVPVNEIRTDQRGDQCKNEGDCQAEQRRLHGVSL
ncbi:hypothetical protein ACVW1C_006544 [Bradyrhizobium sp. USDA 4011]